MNQPSWQRVKDIFADASALAGSERTERVRQAAQGDAEIENEVLRLLRLDDGAEERLAELKPPAEMTQYAFDQHAFCSGDVLAGRYEILRFIAFGGMGEVYEAEDRELGQRIAIKAIRGALAQEDHLLWMKREVQSARSIQHPNVCQVFDVVQTRTPSRDSAVFLTMELLEGETLSEKLRREGALSERQAFPLIRQMVAALSAAHQAGVVHRDFKSGNVMLVPRAGGAPRAVITDFGLARQFPSDRRATVTKWSAGSMAGYGTPAYMAPEQIRSGKVGPAADIYALGVVLYEMLTGDLPYPEDSPLAMAVKKTRERPLAPAKLAPALRPTWSAAILRCLEADPKRRFSDVREILLYLETRSRGRLWWRLLPRRHSGRLKLAAATTGLAAIAAVGWWLWPPVPRFEAVADWERGVFDLQAGEPAQAEQRLERALARHRLPAVAHAYLALAWHELGFDDRARSELNRARYKPFQPEQDRRFEQAVQLQLAGQREQALALLDRRPADLAFLEDQLGKPEAEAHWKQVVIKTPNHPAAHLRLAMTYAKTGRWKEADREFVLAETYFGVGPDAEDAAEMVRAVSARRGLARMQNSDADMARYDFPSVAGFLPRPAGSGYGACERTVTLMAGEADNFVLPFDPIPYGNPDFAKNPSWTGNAVHKQFDQLLDGEIVWVSLILPPLRFCSGQLESRIRKGRDGWQSDAEHSRGWQNDFVWYGSAPTLGRRETLWAGANTNERSVTVDIPQALLLDVQRAQFGKKIISLDVTIGGYSIVDYVKVTLVY